MTDPSGTFQDDLSRDAASWFARMRGPDAEAHQSAFEAWLAQGPDQRGAYNRAAEIFAMGKLLADEPAPAGPHERRVMPAALALAGAAALAAAFWLGPGVVNRSPPARAPTAQTSATMRLIATGANETRLARLDDGSSAQLASDTMLEQRFGPARRLLVLTRGAARFDVRHERRPFVVLAGGGSVTARGTLFEVRLVRPGQVDVQLIRGVIDVALPRRTTGAAPVRRLRAGESLSFGVPPSSPVVAQLRGSGPPSPLTQTGTDTADFAAVPVSRLLEQANQSATRPIRLADASLGAQRVSGRFRLDDSERLARRLSDLFGWRVDTRDPHQIVLADPPK